jgi:hypothetical protein
VAQLILGKNHDVRHYKLGFKAGLPDFSWYNIREKIYQITIKFTKWPQCLPNRSKNRPNSHKIYQHTPLQDPPKFTQIGIFGLKICHLATLIQSGPCQPLENVFFPDVESVETDANLENFLRLHCHAGQCRHISCRWR